MSTQITVGAFNRLFSQLAVATPSVCKTYTAKATPASNEVFSTTELLEMVLLGLDMKTLLLSQRVNKDFKATIDRSLPLQQALFFKPLPEESSEPGDEKYNPLLKQLNYLTDEEGIVKISRYHPRRAVRGRRRDCKGNKIVETDYHIDFTTDTPFEDEKDWLRTKCLTLATTPLKPSCYRMLLEQPQADNDVRVSVSSRNRHGQSRSLAKLSVVLRITKDDTLGDLLSKLKDEHLVDRRKYKKVREREGE